MKSFEAYSFKKKKKFELFKPFNYVFICKILSFLKLQNAFMMNSEN